MLNLLEQAQQRLNQSGGRMTTQRQLILETIQEMSGHPTAEEIYELVLAQDDSLHLSTVYRTLRWLENEGLVTSRLFNDERRQERFDPALPSEHYHFLCQNCKTVIEFNNLLVNAIKAQFELHSGAYVEQGSVVLYGLCRECRQLLADEETIALD